MTADPYPEDVFDAPPSDSPMESISTVERELLRVLTRIAVALEGRPQPVQNGPQRLAALPPVQVAQPVQSGAGCPIHNVPWKVVPAGVSKKTGQPYDAFQACSVSGCAQRPPR